MIGGLVRSQPCSKRATERSRKFLLLIFFLNSRLHYNYGMQFVVKYNSILYQKSKMQQYSQYRNYAGKIAEMVYGVTTRYIGIKPRGGGRYKTQHRIKKIILAKNISDHEKYV